MCECRYLHWYLSTLSLSLSLRTLRTFAPTRTPKLVVKPLIVRGPLRRHQQQKPKCEQLVLPTLPPVLPTLPLQLLLVFLLLVLPTTTTTSTTTTTTTIEYNFLLLVLLLLRLLLLLLRLLLLLPHVATNTTTSTTTTTTSTTNSIASTTAGFSRNKIVLGSDNSSGNHDNGRIRPARNCNHHASNLCLPDLIIRIVSSPGSDIRTVNSESLNRP
jgi:hypothetical protein